MSRWRRFARFNAVSLAGVAVQLAVLRLLLAVAPDHLMTATAAAVAVTVVHNFAWHWRWTWRDHTSASGLLTTFGRFVLANGALSLAGNLLVTGALAAGTSASPTVANAAAIGACGLANFWLGHTRVFRPDGPARPGRPGGPAVRDRTTSVTRLWQAARGS